MVCLGNGPKEQRINHSSCWLWSYTNFWYLQGTPAVKSPASRWSVYRQCATILHLTTGYWGELIKTFVSAQKLIGAAIFHNIDMYPPNYSKFPVIWYQGIWNSYWTGRNVKEFIIFMNLSKKVVIHICLSTVCWYSQPPPAELPIVVIHAGGKSSCNCTLLL